MIKQSETAKARLWRAFKSYPFVIIASFVAGFVIGSIF